MTGAWERPRVGVSSCLLGEKVRFSGGHKRYRFLTDELGPYVDWVPYCPEVMIGLGTPREPIRLTADGTLREGFFLDLLRRGFSADEARRQLDIAIDWGRYGELFEYDAERGELILETAAATVRA